MFLTIRHVAPNLKRQYQKIISRENETQKMLRSIEKIKKHNITNIRGERKRIQRENALNI